MLEVALYQEIGCVQGLKGQRSSDFLFSERRRRTPSLLPFEVGSRGGELCPVPQVLDVCIFKETHRPGELAMKH